jgi:hypothetical protein
MHLRVNRVFIASPLGTFGNEFIGEWQLQAAKMNPAVYLSLPKDDSLTGVRFP